MARAKAKHADIQQDKTLFDAYCAEIQELGVDLIVDKSGISRTTVYGYMRHIPVNKSTEEAIIDAVIECRNARNEARRKRQESARQALNV